MINKTKKKLKLEDIEINSQTVDDPGIIANKFNNVFTNIGPELQKTIPSCTKTPGDYLSHSAAHSLFFAPTTDHEVGDVILNLKIRAVWEMIISLFIL
jgi:hypothetical protein